MIHPRQQSTNAAYTTYAHLSEFPNGSSTAAAPFGTSAGFLQAGNLPVVLTNTSFTLPYAGVFLITYAAGSAGTIAANFSTNLGSSITVYSPNIFQDNSTSFYSCTSSTGTQSLLMQAYTVATPGVGANNRITISGLTSMTGGKLDVMIVQLPSTLAYSAMRLNNSMEEIMSKMQEMETNLRRLTILAHDENHVTTTESDGEIVAEEEKEIERMSRSSIMRHIGALVGSPVSQPSKIRT